MAKHGKYRDKRSFGMKFWDVFRQIDMFGKSIVLNYKGKSTYTTYIGGVATFLIFGLITAYIILQFYIMISRSKSNITKNTYVQELDKDKTVHYIGESDLVFGLSLKDDNQNQIIEDSMYVTYTVKQVSQQYVTDNNGDSSLQRTKAMLEMHEWGTNTYSKVSDEIVQRVGADEFMWPVNLDYSVRANFYAERYDYIEIKFYKCNSSASSCANDVDDVLQQSQLQITFQNSYFDISNYTQPVQYYLDDHFFWDISPSFRKKTDIYVRAGEGETRDEFIQLYGSSLYKYYTIADSRDQLVVLEDDLQFMSISIRLDSLAEKYERRVYSISDLLAQAGGLYQSIFLISMLLIGVFTKRLFVSSILSKIYQIDEIREAYLYLENKKSKESDENNIANDQLNEDGYPADVEVAQHKDEKDSVHLSELIKDGVIHSNEDQKGKKAFVETVNSVDRGNYPIDVEKDK